jgi:hypothetical protein
MPDGDITSFPRHDAGSLTAVHTLLDDIDSGALFFAPTKQYLREIASARPDVFEEIQADAKAISTSHKFDFSGWPTEGMALSDVLLETGKELLDEGLAVLPYPHVVFCKRMSFVLGPEDYTRSNEPVGVTGSLTMEYVFSLEYWRGLPESPDRKIIGCRGYSRVLGRTPWCANGLLMTFPDATDCDHWDANPDEGLTADQQSKTMSIAYQFCVSALAALSSKGPHIRTQPAPEKLNKQRAKKGKLPIFEYHIVEIPRWARERAEAQGGTHASPRLHWRRGHVRRLAGERRTLVRAALVGVAENGFINKDYAVR